MHLNHFQVILGDFCYCNHPINVKLFSCTSAYSYLKIQIVSDILIYFDLSGYAVSPQGAEVVGTGMYQTLDAPLDYIPVHTRGGVILPTQQPANNTHFRSVF